MKLHFEPNLDCQLQAIDAVCDLVHGQGTWATCIKAMANAPPIAKTRLQWRKADLAIGRSGVDVKEITTSAPVTLGEGDIELPDILTDLQDKTQLTRRRGHQPSQARGTESKKIECGMAHFKALAVREAPARYIVARTVDDVLSNA